MAELGGRHPMAVLSWVGPDGFPIAVRVPVSRDDEARLIRIDQTPAGLPLAEGRACLTAHAHGEDFTWQENFQVRGDLVERNGAWALVPHKLIGGFELPKGLGRLRSFASRQLALLQDREATSAGSRLGVRERFEARVPGAGQVGVDARLVHLAAQPREQPGGGVERVAVDLGGPVGQPPAEVELAVGDPELDLVADLRRPVEEAPG